MHDNDARNEDWLRTLRWDLPTNIVQLEAIQPLEHLVELDCWDAAPADVRTQVLGELERRQQAWWATAPDRVGRTIEGTFAEDRNNKP